MVHLQAPLRVLQVALILGWIADLFFYNKYPGISVPLFVLLILGSLFVLGRMEGVRPAWANLWLVAPLLFFATMVFVRENATLTFLNLCAVFVLLCVIVFFYSGDRVYKLSLLGYPAVLLVTLGHLLARPAPAISVAARAASAQRHRINLVRSVLRGVFLAVPLLMIFTALLSSADSIFAGYVADLFQLDFIVNLPDTFAHLTFILCAAWLTAGALLYALQRRLPARGAAPGPTTGSGSDEPSLPGMFNTGLSIGFVETVVVLTLVNLLFLVFAYVQFTNVIFGNLSSMHYEAYREYVRRGFGELLVAASLTMVLILGLRTLGWRETYREIRIFNLLGSLMIVLAGVMLVSAFMRMVVWESVQFYINTPMRIYVRWFIIWLGLLFAWLLVTFWYRQERFAVGALVAAMGFMVSINLSNPDATTAAYNLQRKDDLATRYLYLLSDDAVPVLVAGYDYTTGQVRERLRAHLVTRLTSMEADALRQPWPSFHLARWRAHELLAEMRAAGKLDDPVTEGQEQKGYPPPPNFTLVRDSPVAR
jgi:hypothetical protein